MNPFCFYNDAIIQKNNIHLSIDDLGFSRGYTLFEHCRTYNKKVFHLKEHLTRLFKSAKEIGILIPYSETEIQKILDALMEKNNFIESGFKIYLTLGMPKEGLTPLGKPTFIIYPYPLPSYQGHNFEKGISVHTTRLKRAFPELKTTFYLPGMLARRNAPHADEILFLNDERHFLESTIASFLAFKNDILLIPQGPLLKSITQEVIIQLASPLFKIEKRAISYEELPELTEAFLSTSTKEFLPIGCIDSKNFKAVPRYENTLILRKKFEEYIQKHSWPLIESFSKEASFYLF